MSYRETDALYLMMLAEELDRAERHGAIRDEPEGTRYVLISDTLARRLANDLRRVAKRMRATSGADN
jgi:hypothetical protein